jgi:hypothetical protein
MKILLILSIIRNKPEYKETAQGHLTIKMKKETKTTFIRIKKLFYPEEKTKTSAFIDQSLCLFLIIRRQKIKLKTRESQQKQHGFK